MSLSEFMTVKVTVSDRKAGEEKRQAAAFPPRANANPDVYLHAV